VSRQELGRRRSATSLLAIRLIAGVVLVASAIFDAQDPLGFIALGVAAVASVAGLLFEDSVATEQSLYGDLGFSLLAAIAYAFDAWAFWWVPLVFVVCWALGAFVVDWFSWPRWLTVTMLYVAFATGMSAAGASVMRDYVLVSGTLAVVIVACAAKLIAAIVRHQRH
jgi:hypothetical protein